MALGSVAPVPIRMRHTESTLEGRPLETERIARAGQSAAEETRPIDDIRSTARYRAAVVRNLVVEFLEAARSAEKS